MSKETLKKLLKLLKHYERPVSTALGFLMVIVFVGGIAVFSRYGLKKVNPSSPSTQLPVDQLPTDLNLTSSPTPTSTVRTHTVQSGEGLWQIAQEYYQDGNQYLKIYQANTDKMQNPEDIQAGMRLTIPE